MKLKWPKDRREIFLRAAKAFGMPYGRRTEKEKRMCDLGICHRDFGNLLRIQSAYWWPDRNGYRWRSSCDKERSIFCYLMAALSDKEFEELTK